MANETPLRPPPLHGKCHLKFPFWFFAHLPKEWSRSQCFPLERLGSPGWNPSLFRSCSSSWPLGQVTITSLSCSVLNKTTVLFPLQTPSLCGLPSHGGFFLFWSSRKSSRLSESNGICPCRWDSPLSKSSGSDILKMFKNCVFLQENSLLQQTLHSCILSLPSFSQPISGLQQ